MADADLLFAAHERGVFRYLRRVVGEADAARDLTQEVFLRVSRAREPTSAHGVIGDESRSRAWVFRIARNLALNHLRDRGRQPPVDPLGDVTQPATQELTVALDRALGRLADIDRDVFLLRESVGLSYEDVAAACDITTEAVRARLHRTRQQLRTELGGALARRQTARGVRLTREGREGSGDDD